MAKAEEGSKERCEHGRSDAVYCFPNRVRDRIRARGRGGGAGCKGRGDFFRREFQAVPIGPENGGERSGGAGGEEVAEEGVVHLSRGGGVGEGRKAGRGSAYSYFFDRPDGAGSGPCQEGLPVGRLCSLDGLKIALLGQSGCVLVRGEAGGAGYAGGRVELPPQDGEKGGPPRLGSMGRPLDWGVGGEEGSESREMVVEPSLEGEQGWELRGGREKPRRPGGECGSPSQSGPSSARALAKRGQGEKQ